MSKEVSKKGMKDMVIGKFLERHNSEYESEVRFMLKRKYEGIRKTEEDWVKELYSFMNQKVR